MTDGLYEDKLHRLSLHAYIPEMSLLIVGSQGTPHILLLQIVRSASARGRRRAGRLTAPRRSAETGVDGRPWYRFAPLPEPVWPQECPHSLLCGGGAAAAPRTTRC